MARTVVAYSNWVANSNLSDPAGTAINGGTGNGHVIPAAAVAGSARTVPELTLLRVTNTHSAAHNVVVKAGTNPPALAAGQGDLTVSVGATTGVQWIGPFESGRFIQPDGTMLVDVTDAAHAGTITAFRVPRGT